MENPVTASRYKEAKRKAKEIYVKIGKVWCPALHDQIAFNKKGFDHLTWQGKRSRRRNEQMRRFALLAYAPEILSAPHDDFKYREAEQTFRGKLHGMKNKMTSLARFWGFEGKAEDGNVRVVVRQIGNGQKHFFSIFWVNETKNGP
jgi:hypothetical protein